MLNCLDGQRNQDFHTEGGKYKIPYHMPKWRSISKTTENWSHHAKRKCTKLLNYVDLQRYQDFRTQGMRYGILYQHAYMEVKFVIFENLKLSCKRKSQNC